MNNRYGFIHIPKTAGRAAMTSVIEAPTEDVRIANLFELANFPEVFDGCRVLAGHIPRFMYDWLKPPRKLMTVLRQPIRRVASNYRYTLAVQDHPANRFMRHYRPSLAESYAHQYLRNELSNFQTKMLGMDATAFPIEWPPRGLEQAKVFAVSLTELQYMPVTREMLDRAKHLLSTSIGVACIERPYSVLALCSEMAGRPVTRLDFVNRTPPVKWHPSQEEYQMIVEHNQFDLELYQHALDLVDSRPELAPPT